jgi:hypothetical protein
MLTRWSPGIDALSFMIALPKRDQRDPFGAWQHPRKVLHSIGAFDL